jgi:hypothetical protein
MNFGRFLFLTGFYFLLLSWIDPANAQDVNITIKVRNQKNEPIGFATITAINRLDSSRNVQATADSNGIAGLGLRRTVRYTLRISAVDYQVLEKGIVVGNGLNEFNFTLEPASKTLGGVVVRSSRPLMKQEDDKIIVDPENLASSSTNGYEILEKTPGLFVDQDGNVYIASTTPATILINGRDTKMSTADIATMLKNLPPNAIQSIEIVRTPSAKYDASSSGGVVNIILRKGVKLGLTGSVNAGMQQGVYGNQFAGLTLNNNSGGKSSFLNLNYSRRNSYEEIMTNRLFAPDTLLSQDAFTKYPSNVYYAGYGYSFPVNKKWDLEFSASGSYNHFKNRTNNTSTIRKVSNSQKLTENLNLVNNDGYSLNLRSSATARLKIDTVGSEWVNDVFYNYTGNKTDQVFNTNNFFPVSFQLTGDGTSNNQRNLVNLQSDLKLKMKRRFTFEAGVKSSFLQFRNVADYFNGSGGSRQKDISRTNTFHYNENINALYVQGSKTLGKDAVIKFGTRLENTNMRGQQLIPSDTSFTIHRTDLFPYVYLSKKVISIAGFELRAYLVYRRTIARPVYEQLNPFSRYVDQYLSERGNPALRPQFNNNYEANISVNETPLLAIGVNQTKDIFTNVIYQADSAKSQAYRTYDNLGSNKEIYIRGLGAIPPGHRYFFVVGGQYNHNFYQGLYENKPLSFKKGSWTFFTYHTLKLDKLSQITVNGFIRFQGQLQFYELSTFGALNASINRQFFKQKLVVTLSANDLFKTLRYDFTINQGSVNADGSRLNDSRRFGINFRYNFGIRKKEENNNMFNVESPEKTN